MNDVLTPRILMLDFDGVLNRDNTYYSKEPIDRTLVHRVGDMVQRLGAHDSCVRIESYDQRDQTIIARHCFESLGVSSIGGSQFTV